MFQMKYLDGSPVDKAYADRIAHHLSSAAIAEEIIPIDELEEFANKLRENSGRQSAQEQASA